MPLPEEQDLRAQKELARIDSLRAAAAAASKGLTADEFAQANHLSTTTAARLFASVRRHGGTIEVRPLEIILRAWIQGSTRELLLEQLTAYPYSHGTSAPYPHDGYSPGTWDEVRLAATMGYLSNDELTYVQRHRATNPKNG